MAPRTAAEVSPADLIKAEKMAATQANQARTPTMKGVETDCHLQVCFQRVSRRDVRVVRPGVPRKTIFRRVTRASLVWLVVCYLTVVARCPLGWHELEDGTSDSDRCSPRVASMWSLEVQGARDIRGPLQNPANICFRIW